MACASDKYSYNETILKIFSFLSDMPMFPVWGIPDTPLKVCL